MFVMLSLTINFQNPKREPEHINENAAQQKNEQNNTQFTCWLTQWKDNEPKITQYELAIDIQQTPTRASFEISFSDMEGNFEEDSHQRLTLISEFCQGRRNLHFEQPGWRGFQWRRHVRNFKRKFKKFYRVKSSRRTSALDLSTRTKRFGSFPIVTCLMRMPPPSMVQLFGYKL